MSTDQTVFPNIPTTPPAQSHKPIALVVLLENVGHVAGLRLPQFVMSSIDFITEEYAKLLLRVYGAHQQYDRVVILEDELATSQQLADAILRLSPIYTVDLLLLVHGHDGKLVGYRGQEMIGDELFNRLHNERKRNPQSVDIRIVFGLNCYGLSLVHSWRRLGSTVANGTPGVNWLPEPSLSVFLRNWLAGRPYSESVQRSNRYARIWGRRLMRNRSAELEHPMIASSRQIIYGDSDVTIHDIV